MYTHHKDSTFRFIELRSKEFVIHKDRIGSEVASFSIYYGDDSIYHPGLRMKFINLSKELSLLRYEEGLAQSPYFDTYHKSGYVF